MYLYFSPEVILTDYYILYSQELSYNVQFADVYLQTLYKEFLSVRNSASPFRNFIVSFKNAMLLTFAVYALVCFLLNRNEFC